MKNLITTFLFSSLIFATPVIAGSDHDHGHSHDQKAASSEIVLNQASKKVKELVDAGKIDASWAEVKSSEIKQKTFSHDPEWVVTFKNTKISDSSKQALYLFFHLNGRYIATNYTGK
jgi:hypothetical protein